ncbi:MAG TPA: GtrA family protein [Acidimicrobiia bacterium]|nr:GtrA family protein [Acidimicrobiia bacterium]
MTARDLRVTGPRVPSPSPSPLQVRLRRLLRYGAVSVVSTTVSLSVLGLLVSTRALAPGWANVVATACGTVPSFELNRRWVWRRSGRRSIVAEVGPFCALTFAGLALSTVAVACAGAFATSSGLSDAMRTLVIELANLAAWGSIWLAQFVVLDRILFADRTPRTPGAGSARSQDRPAESQP